MADNDSQSRDELENELATVRSQMAELENEWRLYRKLHFSTEFIDDRLRPLRRRHDELTAALERTTPDQAPKSHQWVNVQRSPSPSD